MNQGMFCYPQNHALLKLKEKSWVERLYKIKGTHTEDGKSENKLTKLKSKISSRAVIGVLLFEKFHV